MTTGSRQHPVAHVDVLATRIGSLLLADHAGRSVADVVEWFGAMQGQDMASVSWSLGLRTGTTASQVAAAFEAGAIVRTWPMRGTLHVVPGRDAAWMVKHLGVRALAGAERRRAVLGLDGSSTDRAVEALADALRQGPMTRSECATVMKAAGADTAGQRTYHLLWYACQRGLACVGPDRGKEQTFVRLDAVVHDPVELDRDQALARIAQRFVRSHGPVSAADLARWADLTLTDARAGIAAAEGLVQRSIAGRQLVLMEAALDGEPPAIPPALALPGFDEYVLGYRDRTVQLPVDHERRIVPGGNGVFAPTLVARGRVVGTWRRRMLTRRVVLTATPFDALSGRMRGLLEVALGEYGRFVGMEPDVRWTGV